MPLTPALLTRVHDAMSAGGLDVLLLNAPANVWYLSGYPLALTGLQRRGYARNAVVIIPLGGQPILVVGAFEEQISRAASWIADIETFDDYLVPPTVGAADVVRKRGLPRARVGIESAHLSEHFWRSLRDALPDAEFVAVDHLLYSLRMVKTAQEIIGMETAYQTGGQAAAEVLKEAGPGMTEVDLRNRIMAALVRALWSERVDGAVLSGPRIVAPGGQASERKLARGDWVRLEYTFMQGSSAGRLCRMGTVGDPSAHQLERFRAYAAACIAAIGELRPGQSCAEVHGLFREAFAGRDVGQPAGSVGSGLGYGPIEPPYLVPNGRDGLVSDMILSIEPMTADGLCANWIIHVQRSSARILDCAFSANELFVID